MCTLNCQVGWHLELETKKCIEGCPFGEFLDWNKLCAPCPAEFEVTKRGLCIFKEASSVASVKYAYVVGPLLALFLIILIAHLVRRKA